MSETVAAPEVIRRPQTLDDWLTEFRRATPRAERQALIDTMDLEVAVEALPLHYRRVVYVLAARAMQWGEAFPFVARQAILAAIVAKGCGSIARDTANMMTRLAQDHRRYLRFAKKKTQS